jgi:N-acetylglucosaminyl-diphospho-decaprenol L-rhamnosyltransferase
MNQTHISVVIVSYEVRELLLACLYSIEKAPGGIENIEIIVVDNNSSDGSAEAVRQNFPYVKVIDNKFNSGFSAGNNQGIALAKGKYIFLLNPDTEVVGDALHDLERYLDNHPACSLVAPQLLNSDGSIQVSAWKNHRVSTLIVETFYLHKFINTINYPPDCFEREFEPLSLSGAALFFRKSLTEEIGMLDEQLFWMEDIDFCFRARQRGKLAYFLNAKVVHHSGQSQKKNYNISISNQLISKLKYFRKHTGRLAAGLANLSCFLFVCSRILAFSVVSPFGKLYRMKAKAYFYTFSKLMRYLILNDTSVV